MVRLNFGARVRRGVALLLSATLVAAAAQSDTRVPGQNPIITDMFTADPAPLVIGDTVYLYTGHDEARGTEMFTMRDWQVFTSKDLKHWTPHGAIMTARDFKWAKKDAWASQVTRKNGKYYFYVAVEHDDTHKGKAIGVAVSDSPLGPFRDARGSALVTNDMTPQGPHTWDDIDPTVFTERDGTSWLIWGNAKCYMAKLKPNMTELDGPITEVAVPNFVEGPWIHKRGKFYYLTYASMNRAAGGRNETISYAMAPAITGPWTFKGQLTGEAKNSFTIHPGIIEFKGQWYLFYHNAALTIGDQSGAVGRRAVAIERLYYNPDGTMRPVTQTVEGLSAPARR